MGYRPFAHLGDELALLALAYALGPAFLYPEAQQTDDAISHYVCLNWGCPDYPDLGWKAFVIYLTYSVLAIVIVLPLIYLLGKRLGTKGDVTEEAAKQGSADLNPNLAGVVLVNALLLALISAITKF